MGSIVGVGVGAGFGGKRWTPIDLGSGLVEWYDVSSGAYTLRATSLVNGTFDADSTWTKGANATISGGALRGDGLNAGNDDTTQASVGIVGDTYDTTLDIESISGGTLQILLGTTALTARSTAGSFVERGNFAGTTTITIRASAGCQYVLRTVTCDPAHASQLTGTVNGRHLVHATASRQPVYSPTSLNGKPGLTFNGTSHYLKTGTFTWNQPAFAMGVIKWTHADGDRIWDGNTGSSFLIQYTTADNVYMYCGAKVVAEAQNQPVSGNTYIFELLGAGASSAIAINGNTRTVGNAGSTNPGAFTLGASGAGTAAYAAMTAGEIILMNRDLTADERLKLVRYLNGKWGVF